MGYDVFISYSHGDDDLLSERVQDALSRFAKPWYRRRALNVFRDRTSLSANPGLWSSIAEALENSRYFLFLASPDAAESVWCSREVEHWRSLHGSEGLLILLTDGEILWDETTNDFNWGTTTALGAAFASCFVEEPFFVDMRWARSESQLDLTNGQFRDQIADLAAPVRGMAKDELASEDVKQHRRAIRQAIAAGVALAFLTVAAVVTSFFAVNNAGAARRSAERARTEFQRAEAARAKEEAARRLADEKRAEAQRQTLLAQRKERERARQAKIAREQKGIAEDQRGIAERRSEELGVANTNLTIGSRALRKSTLLAQARLAARRSEQLMSSGDQTYQLGVSLAAEAVRHACASGAIDPAAAPAGDANYPNDGCTQPFIPLDGSVANRALVTLANAGGKFATARLAGSVSPHLVSWSSGGNRFATFSSAQSIRPDVVEVWNTDGTRAASATSVTGLSADTALSGDGSVLAVTANAAGGTNSVSAWSLASGQALAGGSGAAQPAIATNAESTGMRRALTSSGNFGGRRPALSTNGATMAWLPRQGSKSINLMTWGSRPRSIALPAKPVGVAVSPDGSLVAVLLPRGGDRYALVPIDAASGKAGAERDLGFFATPRGSYWNNPPRVPGASADPPSVWFDGAGSTVWIYNNERHVGAQIVRSAKGPTARVSKIRITPASLGGGELASLVTSTPSGRTAVLLSPTGSVPTYQVFTETTEWTTPGVVPLELCSSDTCNLSINPTGTTLAVTSLSALQIIDLRAPASATSGTIANQGAFPAGTSVVVGPTGRSGLSWSARSLVIVDMLGRSARPVAVPLGATESISAVGSDPSGQRYVAIIGRGDGCPCRVAVVDAATGNVVRTVGLGATALDRITNAKAVGVALSDNADIVAVTFDNNPKASGSHRAGLATYSLANGQPFRAAEYPSLGLGTQSLSVPAFEPGTETVALVATRGSSREVSGVLVDARTLAVAHRLSMKAGVVTVDSSDYGNDGYALRFSPNAQLLAWNVGGSVVIWSVGEAAEGQPVESDVVLTSKSFFDPTALAISNNGEVATVGQNYYQGSGNRPTDVVLTGDELGRFLQPLGVARIASSEFGQVAGRIAVAMPETGEVVAVALDFNGSRFFADTWGATPADLLGQLCRSSSRALSESEWETYFPGEPYHPACPTGEATTPWNIDASPGFGQASAFGYRRRYATFDAGSFA